MIRIELAKPTENKLPNESHRQTYHRWCEGKFGQHNIMWWNYNGVFTFRNEEDATMFMLRWA